MQAHVQELRTTLVFVVSLDVSGSMHGSRLTKAVHCLGNIFHSVMREHDQYGCYLFHNEVEKLHAPMPKTKVKWERDMINILKHGGGGTALYDAIIEGVRAVKEFDFKDEGPDHKYVVEHLVITDGEDNSSRSNVGSAEHCVEHSRVGDYHLNIISIGIDVEHEVAMKRVTRSRHAHYYPVRDLAQFERRMKDVTKQIRARLRITHSDGQVEEYQFEGGQSDARAVMPQMLQASGLEQLLAQMQLGWSLGQ
jgi:Mg-chelatase subunit ChlD